MRRRPIPKQDLESGQDSFLDVVSNIVGILIILVVVVGAQVKNGLTSARLAEMKQTQSQESPSGTPSQTDLSSSPNSDSNTDSDSPSDSEFDPDTDLANEIASLMDDSASRKEKEEMDAHEKRTPEQREERKALIEEIQRAAASLEETWSQERHMEEEIAQFQLQKKRMDAEQVIFAGECVQLEARKRLIQQEMQNASNAQEQKDREILALSQTSISLQKQLEELQARLETVLKEQAANGGPKKIEHKKTPIVRTVDTQEFHFILDRGYVLYVPMDELLREYERKIPAMGTSLIQSGVHTEILGPYDGFKLHTETRIQSGRISVRWYLIAPEIEEVGEPVQQALAQNSKFRYHMEKLTPKKDILTFWIYPEGFGSYQQMKDEAYRQGFSIASRPLPEGAPIAGSPDGQKSLAQ